MGEDLLAECKVDRGGEEGRKEGEEGEIVLYEVCNSSQES